MIVSAAQEPCKRTIEAKDLVVVGKAIQLARKQIRLRKEYRVLICWMELRARGEVQFPVE